MSDTTQNFVSAVICSAEFSPLSMPGSAGCWFESMLAVIVTNACGSTRL